MSRARLYIISAICMLFPTTGLRAAPPPSPVVPAVVSSQPAPEAAVTFDSYRKAVGEERTLLEKQADRQFVAVDSLLTRAIWVFGTILTAAIGIFVWMFGNSRKDFEKAINQNLEAQAKEIIEREAEKLRQRYTSLQEQVDELIAYRSKVIVWIAPAGEPQEALFLALRAAGLASVSVVSPAQGATFDVGDPDLVILSFDGTNEGRRLMQVAVDKLRVQSPPVPLLIYTFSRDRGDVRLGAEERTILNDFDWYIPVNFPAQLVAQTLLLAKRSRGILGGLDAE
jgi:hypothetical protein